MEAQPWFYSIITQMKHLLRRTLLQVGTPTNMFAISVGGHYLCVPVTPWQFIMGCL